MDGALGNQALIAVISSNLPFSAESVETRVE